ncbi:hypothetical protein GW17_00016617 [Ensete ventricosum]|nr:hypothetical protein GW17_00016617 [Ensete ventricosum]
MQTTICFTNHGGVGQFSVPQPPQAVPLPWWIGSQSLFEGHSNGEDQLPAASRQLHHAVVPRVGPGPAVTEERGTVTTTGHCRAVTVDFDRRRPILGSISRERKKKREKKKREKKRENLEIRCCSPNPDPSLAGFSVLRGGKKTMRGLLAEASR